MKDEGEVTRSSMVSISSRDNEKHPLPSQTQNEHLLHHTSDNVFVNGSEAIIGELAYVSA